MANHNKESNRDKDSKKIGDMLRLIRWNLMSKLGMF